MDTSFLVVNATLEKCLNKENIQWKGERDRTRGEQRTKLIKKDCSIY